MIYLDNAATTRITPYVELHIEPYINKKWANASAMYGIGCDSYGAINKVRRIVANFIGSNAGGIYFTSGATESNNWVLNRIKCTSDVRTKIITTNIEHPSILETCKYINNKVEYVHVKNDGRVDMDELERLLYYDVRLVSVMLANNEIGTIQDLKSISELAHRYGAEVHCDATQALGYIDVNVDELGVDYLSASGHKFHGLKGVGFLYIRNTDNIYPFMTGGHQEDGMRAGTYNTLGIVSMGAAIDEIEGTLDHNYYHLKSHRDYLIDKMIKEIPDCTLNGSREYRLPGNANFCIKGVDSAVLMTNLDAMGVCVSAGSACSSDSSEPSYVLKAIGLSDEDANSSIRVTLSMDITFEQLDQFVKLVKTNVEMIRQNNTRQNLR